MRKSKKKKSNTRKSNRNKKIPTPTLLTNGGSPEKDLGGRPKIEIDFNQFEKLCSLQCTLAEIAFWFECSEDTIERRVKEHYEIGFADIYKKHSAGGKISLRRRQFEMAMGEKDPNDESGRTFIREPNITMLIWLGKNWLGQKDKHEFSGDQYQPFVISVGGGVNLKDYPPDEKPKK